MTRGAAVGVGIAVSADETIGDAGTDGSAVLTAAVGEAGSARAQAK
jgi:hypothetical protein